MFTLADHIAMLEDSDELTFAIQEDPKRDPIRVKFIDDYGLGSSNGSFFAAGFEFGPHVLIHASSFESAWKAWIDSLPTIPEDELIEAYGIVDSYRDEYVAKHGGPPEYYQRDAWEAWHAAFKDACKARLQQLSDDARGGNGDYPELIQGYEYQSNASGTGIVDVGHYAWMNEVDPAHVVIMRADESERDEVCSQASQGK